MKKLMFLAIMIMAVASVWGQKTYVMHYLPILTEKQAESYKGYDLIIPDHEVINTSSEQLRKMRRDNPDLKILAYVNKIEWHDPMFSDKPWSLKMVYELKKYPNWFLRGTDGKKLEFWPGTVLMNCRLDCPRYNIGGKSYNYIEWFTERYIKDIIDAYERAGIKLDGILDDELLKSISFIGSYGKNTGVDGNDDKITDDGDELDRNWRLGNAYFLNAVRQKMGPDFLIIGNGGHGYYMDWCQGKQFEYFPEVYLNESDNQTEAWPENMRNASGMRLALFNARTNSGERTDNWFFTICSSMLLDNTWFSFGQNTSYKKDYKLNLGLPLGVYQQDEKGTFIRSFQNGTIYVNPVSKKAWVEK